LRSRALSPVELATGLIERIHRYDRNINAVTTLTAESCLQRARVAEIEIRTGRWRGPLHGVPFLLKDIIETEGIRTGAGSRICDNFIPVEDAEVVKRMYSAGAVLVGKATTHEFAHGGPSFDLPWPPARNPWNTNHFSGGSSSGSAAAVAAGFVPIALGTDTGGSIRIPAAMCGTVGLKPTYGLVSRRGIIPNSYSLDTCGPLTRTVEDAALGLQAIAGFDPGCPGSVDGPIPDYVGALARGIEGLRIGVLRHFWERDHVASAPVASAMEDALDVLRGLGAQLGTAHMRPIQQYSDVKVIMSESELLSIHQQDFIDRPQAFGRIFAGRVLGACLFSATDYVNAQRERRLMAQEAGRLFEDFDVLVTLGPGPAPRLADHNPLAEKWSKPSLTAPFNVTGQPAIAVCMGFAQNGMPLSMQIVGRSFDEAMVLRVAHAYEQATGWCLRRPQLAETVVEHEAPPPPPQVPAISELDEFAIDEARRAAARAGLVLPDDMIVQIAAAAPHALAMATRLRRARARAEEPAAVFVSQRP
jgi:aspartyl-tRNA(Asn)/glutamyl-tRNA(Gln) amidotransferase subunit A